MRATTEQRFWRHVDFGGPLPDRSDPLVTTDGQCWLWASRVDRGGYGHFYAGDRRTVLAHRFAYELMLGPIPDGMQLDHRCRVRHCIRPDHLEPVSMRENMLRGDSPAARAVRTGRCKHGHSHWGVSKGGRGRYCIDCSRAAARRVDDRRKEASRA